MISRPKASACTLEGPRRQKRGPWSCQRAMGGRRARPDDAWPNPCVAQLCVRERVTVSLPYGTRWWPMFTGCSGVADVPAPWFHKYCLTLALRYGDTWGAPNAPPRHQSPTTRGESNGQAASQTFRSQSRRALASSSTRGGTAGAPSRLTNLGAIGPLALPQGRASERHAPLGPETPEALNQNGGVALTPAASPGRRRRRAQRGVSDAH